MIQDLFIESLWVFAPLMMLFASILAWRQRRGWPAVLQIVGSAAFLIWGLYSVIFIVGGATGALDPHFLWTAKGSWIRHVAIRMLWVAGISFPIGFFWHTLRGTRLI